MKLKNTSGKNRIETLVLPGAALLLLVCAWVVGAKGPWRLVLSLLSFLVSLFALRDELLTAFRSSLGIDLSEVISDSFSRKE